MAVLETCCYFKTLRRGSYASAIYTLIYFGFSCLILLVFLSEEVDFLSGKRERPAGESILEKGDITSVTVIFNILFLICSAFLVLSSILVLIGLRTDKRELLLPWILFMLCDVVIELAHLVYLSLTQKVVFDPIVGFLFTMDFFLMSLNFYCLLCVISQYQDYLRGRGYNTARMRNDLVMPVMPNNKHKAPYTSVLHQQGRGGRSPLITSHQRSNISTIPEELDHNHRLGSNADASSCREESISQSNDLEVGSKSPVLTLEARRNTEEN